MLPLDVLRRSGGRRSDAPRDALDDRHQVPHLSAFDDVALQAAWLEHDASGADHEHVVGELERADHHLGRPDELADANDGGIGQRRGGRHLQALECRGAAPPA